MPGIETIIFYVGCAAIGYMLPPVVKWIDGILRKHVPYAGKVLDVLYTPAKLWRKYVYHYTRLLLPDSLYKLWYKTGIMDIESYRAFQSKGYIKDDLDPKLIQRNEDVE